MNRWIRFFLTLALIAGGPFAHAATLDEDIVALQHGWAQVYYQTPKAQQGARIEELARQSADVLARHPQRAEPMIWRAIVLSSQAKISGGLSALNHIKEARRLLEAAIKLDAKALDGSAYTSLGSLYAKAPGWPIAFGNKDKARQYLQQALSINPDGIDPNFFYGELLLDQGDRAAALPYLRKALAAPPRPGREDADAGRRGEIEALLKQAG
jgi:tetratricopeptide (TPR) repeat protein